MSLASTQTITYDGTAVTHNETGRGMKQAEYSAADGSSVLEVKHNKGTRDRSVVKNTRGTIVPNPFNPSVNIRISDDVYLVLNFHPSTPVATRIKHARATVGYLAAGSYANLDKIVAFES